MYWVGGVVGCLCLMVSDCLELVVEYLIVLLIFLGV